MMKHEDIWRAIDTLAAENGLSASGLAKRSGLDPTTFNVSKRRMPDGRNRWPSTESVAKVLNATGASLEAFTALVIRGARPGRPAPGAPGAAGAADRPRPGGRRGVFRRRRLSRSAAAGTRSACRKSPIPTPMRWKSAAIRWSRSIATATWSSSRRRRRSAAATAWWSAPTRARSWPSSSPAARPGGSS